MGVELSFPGQRAKRRFERRTPIDDAAEAVTDSPIHVRVRADSVMSEPLESGRWRLHLYLTLENMSDLAVRIYDLHVNVYARMAYLLAPAAIGWRAWIELYETNSIAPSGKYIDLDPFERDPIELTMEISRHEGFSNDAPVSDGMVLAIFGLFADYETRGKNTRAYRIPSEDVFSFQNTQRGHLVVIN